MPITLTQARKVALESLRSQASKSDDGLVLVDQNTMEREFGWVFFYNSKDCLETGDISHALAGNSPIVVLRADGIVHETGTALPLERVSGEVSREGVSAKLSAGLIVGGEVAVNNLQNAVPCAQ